jgi:hypothetical protein
MEHATRTFVSGADTYPLSLAVAYAPSSTR